MNLDAVTLKRCNLLHPKLRTEAIALYGQVACALTGKAFCRFDMTLRTIAEQDALYALGRTKRNPDGYDPKRRPMGNIVTNATGGKSFHNYGLAIDYFLVTDRDGDGKYDKAEWDIKHDFDGDGKADWMEVKDIFVAAGWEWGGSWRTITDNPHVQRTFGLRWQDCYALYTAGKVDKEGYIII
jgi:peptidoglycan L-alanyl-D-glutamate endopeptidase CwlK